MERAQREERERREKTAYNLARGLPPVLSAAEKLDKLRKMDALQHGPESEATDYKNVLQGRVWKAAAPGPTAHVLGSDTRSTPGLRPSRSNEGSSGSSRGSQENMANEDGVTGVSREELRRLKPMTPEEFMERFRQLTCGEPSGAAGRAAGADRFSEIKSSLRALRRGLNEVTAPYNSAPASNAVTSTNNSAPASNAVTSRSGRRAGRVELPCEFCSALVPAARLVLHQTGCRPDLAQRRARSPAAPPARPLPFPSDPYENPVIPCEFCTESLPVYLIAEHQEHCRRGVDALQLPD